MATGMDSTTVTTPLLQQQQAPHGHGGGGSRSLEAILSDASSPWARRALRGARVELPLLLRIALPAVGRVHDQLPHVHVHADLLRPARQPRARRRLARQHGHPGVRLRAHARDGQRGGDAVRAGVRREQAGHVPAALGGAPGGHGGDPRRRVRVLRAHRGPPRRVGAHRPRRRRVRLRPRSSRRSSRTRAANFPIQKFLQAQSIVAPSAYISAATLALHVALTWLAVDRLGMGLLGGALVLSLSWWVTVLAQLGYIVASGQPQVQGDVDRVRRRAGVPGARRILQALGGVRRHAMPGDVVEKARVRLDEWENKKQQPLLQD